MHGSWRVLVLTPCGCSISRVRGDIKYWLRWVSRWSLSGRFLRLVIGRASSLHDARLSTDSKLHLPNSGRTLVQTPPAAPRHSARAARAPPRGRSRSRVTSSATALCCAHEGHPHRVDPLQPPPPHDLQIAGALRGRRGGAAPWEASGRRGPSKRTPESSPDAGLDTSEGAGGTYRLGPDHHGRAKAAALKPRGPTAANAGVLLHLAGRGATTVTGWVY
jgi:hypothetical protein